MIKINQKPDFSNHTIYVGIDVHLKSWNVSLYCNQQYLKSFNQPPLPDALQSFLLTLIREHLINVHTNPDFVVIGFRENSCKKILIA